MGINGLCLPIAALVAFFASAATAWADPDKLPPEYSPWSGLTGGVIGAASGTGFAIWIAWYLITRVLPEREKTFAADREAATKRNSDRFELQEKRHADHLAAEKSEYREDMREAWKNNREIADQYKVALERIIEKIEGSCRYKKE